MASPDVCPRANPDDADCRLPGVPGHGRDQPPGGAGRADRGPGRAGPDRPRGRGAGILLPLRRLGGGH
ncbi:hypothetical protein VP06_31915, partial [Methylobacterium aquaticum]